jgi:tetratricopeptide (TPR) repeat protein
MRAFDLPGLLQLARTLIQDHPTMAFAFGTMALAAGRFLLWPLWRRDEASATLPPRRILLFGDYRAALNRRQQQIREAMPGSVGNRLALLEAELAAVEGRLTNLADSFFMLKSELAQAEAALASMRSDASGSQLIGARRALEGGDTRPAEIIFARAASCTTDRIQAAEAHYRLGRLASANIDYAKALEHLRRAAELAPDDFRIGASLAELAGVMSRLVDVEPLPPAALAVLEEVLLVQGKHGAAEQLYRHALAYHERACGPDHPRTAASLESLARLYRRQQKHDEAAALYERVLTIVESSAGSSHPEVAVILERLAGVYRAQEKRECVWRCLRRVLMIKEAMFGSDRPDVIDVVHDLANISRDVGRLSEAELLYRRLLVARERAFGPDHLNVAIILRKLAEVCDLAGNYEEAETLHIRTLSIRERALSADHPSCADTLRSLARVYRKQGKDRLAEPLCRRALAISERASVSIIRT